MTEHKQFFIDTAFEISSSLGYEFSKDEIEQMCLDNHYHLHLKPINNDNLHIGIYPVGNWNFKIPSDNPPDNVNLIPNIHMNHNYHDYDIIVFVTHDWSEDRFTYLYSKCQQEIEFKDENADDNKKKIIELIQYYQKNPIKAYSDLVDFDEICLRHRHNNRVFIYCKAWIKNNLLKKVSHLFKPQ